MKASFEPKLSLLYPKRLTIASYPGGKSDKRKHQTLYSNLAKNTSLLLEPFAGLANVALTLSPLLEKFHLNDIDPEIYSLLLCMKNKSKLEELIEEVDKINPINRDDYYKWKKQETEEVCAIQKAVRRLVILNCSVSGAGGGYSKLKAKRDWGHNKPVEWRKINEIFNEKKTKISNLDYLEFLNKYTWNKLPKKSLVYLDPPYINVAQTGKLYGKNYNKINVDELLEKLHSIPIRWIMSNRDSQENRQLFQAFFQINYNCYNDMNNSQNKNPELIVSNFILNKSGSQTKLSNSF